MIETLLNQWADTHAVSNLHSQKWKEDFVYVTKFKLNLSFTLTNFLC